MEKPGRCHLQTLAFSIQSQSGLQLICMEQSKRMKEGHTYQPTNQTGYRQSQVKVWNKIIKLSRSWNNHLGTKNYHGKDGLGQSSSLSSLQLSWNFCADPHFIPPVLGLRSSTPYPCPRLTVNAAAVPPSILSKSKKQESDKWVSHKKQAMA